MAVFRLLLLSLVVADSSVAASARHCLFTLCFFLSSFVFVSDGMTVEFCHVFSAPNQPQTLNQEGKHFEHTSLL